CTQSLADANDCCCADSGSTSQSGSGCPQSLVASCLDLSCCPVEGACEQGDDVGAWATIAMNNEGNLGVAYVDYHFFWDRDGQTFQGYEMWESNGNVVTGIRPWSGKGYLSSL